MGAQPAAVCAHNLAADELTGRHARSHDFLIITDYRCLLIHWERVYSVEIAIVNGFSFTPNTDLDTFCTWLEDRNR